MWGIFEKLKYQINLLKELCVAYSQYLTFKAPMMRHARKAMIYLNDKDIEDQILVV
jgi:hypothetical protein